MLTLLLYAILKAVLSPFFPTFLLLSVKVMDCLCLTLVKHKQPFILYEEHRIRTSPLLCSMQRLQGSLRAHNVFFYLSEGQSDSSAMTP